MGTDLQSAARGFLASGRIAVAGVSRSPQQPGHAIYKRLKAARLDVVAVNPAAQEIDGDPCYPDLDSVPGGVEAVVMATPPAASESVARDCVRLGVRRVWIHRAFGAGSVSPEAVRICRENGISLIDGACPLMYCPPVDFPHRCMRGIFGLLRGLPHPSGDWSRPPDRPR